MPADTEHRASRTRGTLLLRCVFCAGVYSERSGLAGLRDWRQDSVRSRAAHACPILPAVAEEVLRGPCSTAHLPLLILVFVGVRDDVRRVLGHRAGRVAHQLCLLRSAALQAETLPCGPQGCCLWPR